jgi:hypothetical protein
LGEFYNTDSPIFLNQFKPINMGYYINKLPSGALLHITGKVKDLLSIPGSEVIPTPEKYNASIHSKKLVCVVSNLAWEAAAYCYDEMEFVRFNNPQDIIERPRIWMLIPGADVLSGFIKFHQVKNSSVK